MSLKKNILIYPHNPFNLADGGTTVQYYLAQILKELGENVKMYNSRGKTVNDIFNDYIDSISVEELENTVVIYCEGIQGNPLNAKYVVRWMLSELGKNVPTDYLYTWGKNELVYYFNPEEKFYKNKEKIGNIYKLLYMNYINPKLKNLNQSRSGVCFTIRKSYHHSQINCFHPEESYQIMRYHTQDDYLEIFNKHKYFISYDPITFLTIISLLCGCISIVYPLEGITKKEWIKNTSIGEFINSTDEEIYGLAYGNSKEELEYAEKTIHLAENQFKNLKKYMIEKMVKPFINDINNFENNINTIENNFFDNNSKIIKIKEENLPKINIINTEQKKIISNIPEYNINKYKFLKNLF